MEKLLTISVAAYNIEQYIDKLMDTITASKQLDRIEVLLVNDGSTDKTKLLGEKYASSFPSLLTVINKENGGHGSTINTGIKRATGKYFRALDGDDWVNTNALDSLIETIEKVESDIIICDYVRCYSDGRAKQITYPTLTPMKESLFEDIIGDIEWIPYHSIIYRTKILQEHDIKLDEHCFYVDSEYDLYPLPFIKTSYYFNEPVYCYRLGINDQSVSPQSRMKNITNARTVADRLIQLFQSTYVADVDEKKKEYILKAVAEQCNWYIESIMLFSPNVKYLKEIKGYDIFIARESKAIYNKMARLGKNSKSIKLLRNTSYIAYWPLTIYKSICRKMQKK